MINTAFSIIDNFLNGIVPIIGKFINMAYVGALLLLAAILILNALYVLIPDLHLLFGDSKIKKFLINEEVDKAMQEGTVNVLPIFLKSCVMKQGLLIVALLLFKILVFDKQFFLG